MIANVRNTPEPPFFIFFMDDAEPPWLRATHPPDVRAWHVVTEAKAIDTKGTMEVKFLDHEPRVTLRMQDYMVAPILLQPDSVCHEVTFDLIDNNDLIWSESMPVCADWLPRGKRF